MGKGSSSIHGPFGVRHVGDGKIATERCLMEKDVVCGMQVDPAKTAGTSEYQGKTYYFCAKSCKARFDANPAQYVKA